MQVILQINAIRAENDEELCYRITATQGGEQITDDTDLLENLKDTVPGKKGVISISRESQNVWVIATKKQ